MTKNESCFAKEIGLLIKDDFRVSRSTRLKWFLDHLLKPVPALCQELEDQDENQSDAGIQPISCIPLCDTITSSSNLLVGTNTKVSFYSTSYKYVFSLDLSSSMMRVDTLQHFVVVEAIITALENCLTSLIHNFAIHDGFVLKPNIYVTVFVQWHGTKDREHGFCNANKILQEVLVQGCCLTEHTLSSIMLKVKTFVYNCKCLNSPQKKFSASSKGDLLNDLNLLGILKTGLLSVKILPSNSKSSIIIITDGVLGEPNAFALERIIKQCQNTTTSCFFLHVSSSTNPLCDFGCLSNVELMHFISKSTNGQYINLLHIPSADSSQSFFQKLLFSWSFQMPAEIVFQKNSLLSQFSKESCSGFQLRNAFLSEIDKPTLIKRKQNERNIMVDLATVVSARLREGFYVKSINIVKNMVEMCLELPWWKNYTVVEYKVSAAWPLNSNQTKIEVFICSTYEFLLDVSKRNETKHWTRSRKQTLRRFLIFFQDLLQSDHMLQYLHCFTDDSAKFSISDPLRQGLALYYLPPNSTQYELSTMSQHISPAFASYWKPILSLDKNAWHQWLHIHKIESILQHDMPLPSNLYSNSNNGRYHIVQCRVAFSLIMSMLRNWCTFVLLENHTYVKFVYDDKNNNIPTSFFLIRLSWRYPTMVLKLAFLIGLSGKRRKQFVEDLCQRISALVCSVPGLSPNTSNRRVRHSSILHSPMRKISCAPNSSSDLPCAFLLHKPLSHLLVRYTQIPENYMEHEVNNQAMPRAQSNVNEQNIRLRDIYFYLKHHRNVWCLTNSTSTPLSLDSACQLAELIQKVRMKEGYRIAHSSSGVINLVKEFPMTYNGQELDGYCLVQYIIFPPKIVSTETMNSQSSFDSDDEDLEDNSFCEKEINLATEIWIEPQYGQVWQSDQFSNFTSVSHYANLNFNEILQHVSDMDLYCISNIVTFEHLKLMCTSSNQSTGTILMFPQLYKFLDLNSSIASLHVGSSPNHNLSEIENCIDTDISSHLAFEPDSKDMCFQYHSNVFDFIALLEHSSRIKHLFMSLTENESNDHTANTKLLENFHKSLASFCDCKVNLSLHDQIAITDHIFPKEKRQNISNTINFEFDNNSAFIWSCYLKIGECGQVFVILLPSSYSIFLNILEMYGDDKSMEASKIQEPSAFNTVETGDCASSIGSKELESLVMSDSKDATFSVKAQRRMSIKRLASCNQSGPNSPFNKAGNTKQQTFYLFVYNCSMKMLQSSFIHGATNCDKNKWADSLQDHRLHFENDVDDYFESFPQKPEYKEPDSPSQAQADISDSAYSLKDIENDSLAYINDSIVWLYHKSFVVGIFYAVSLDNQVFFSQDDLQVATDYLCRECIDEIDITDFVFLNSPQIIEFKANNLKPTMPPDLEPRYVLSSSSADTDSEEFPEKSKHAYKKSRHHNFSEKQKENVTFSCLTKDLADDPDYVVTSEVKSKQNESLAAVGKVVENNPSIDQHLDSKISFHGKSAFTSFHRENHPAVASVTDNSTSDDEVCVLTSQKPSLKSDKKSMTVPIKKILTKEHKYSGLQSGWSNLPSFSLSLLNVSHSRHLSGTSEQIERHFIQLLKSYCKSVNGVPFLFYAVNRLLPPKRDHSENLYSYVDNDLDVEFVSENEKCSQRLMSEDATNEQNTRLSNSELKTPICQVAHDDDDVYSIISDEESIIPLFLYMTCTVYNLQTGNSGSLPVKCLPLNLKEIMDSFDESCDFIDLSKIKITLDLIWIYLPSTSDESHITTVPEECSAIVKDVKEKVKWLLEDEIISSLRTTEPINTATLDRVAKHVKSISQTSNTKAVSVPLQFIFGVDRSTSLLRSEFEKCQINYYRLQKVDHYYFLSLERSFIPIPDSFNLPKNEFSVESIEDQSESSMLENPHSATYLSPKSFVANALGGSQVSISSKNKSQLKFYQTSSASLHGGANGSSEIEKMSQNFNKTLSSTELVSVNSNIVRRCTSASIMSSNSPNEREAKLACHSKSKVELSSLTSPPPLVFHQNLQASLSCGKDSKFFSSGSNQPNVSSMPVTPLGGVNTTEMFVFPPAWNNSKQGSGQGGDCCASPTSEFSARQFSQTSWLGSGYEGEESESGDEFYYRDSFNEACTQQLPSFWLLVSFDNDKANIYYHRRSSTKAFSAVKIEHSRVFKIVSENLQKSCRAVNQTLLLNMLYDDKWCHPLLVEESPEDIWTKDSYSRPLLSLENAEDLSIEGSSHRSTNDYLAASMDFPAGHFECKCVLKQTINLHHRFTVSSKGGTVPSAFSTVRSFMKNFVVSNQKNMFVFQVQDETVYYCRVFEENTRPESNGRRSSTYYMESDPLGVSKNTAESKIVLDWYGVHDPLPQHLNDLCNLKVGIEKELDSTVLEYVTLMLYRNAQFKLTPADVNLIQPRQSDPVNRPVKPDVFQVIALPQQLCVSIPALLYYIHQHLLLFLAIPRYTDPNSGQFLPVLSDAKRGGSSGSSFNSPAIYLYPELAEKSTKLKVKSKRVHGIACICLDYTEKNRPHIVQPSTFNKYNSANALLEFTKMSVHSSITDTDNYSSILIYMWTKGSLNLNVLHKKMQLAVQHALFDAVTEHCLELPFVSPIPVKTKAMKPLFSDNSKEDSVSISSYIQSKLGVGNRLNEGSSKKQPDPKEINPPNALLNKLYYQCFPAWIELKVAQSLPSAVVKTINFPGKLNDDQVVSNVSKILSVLIDDSEVLKFYKNFSSDDKWTYADQNYTQKSRPGCYTEYLLFTRNFHLWKKATKSISLPPKASNATAALQKFSSHDINLKPDTSPCPQHDMMMSSSFIPRQHCVCVALGNGQIRLCAYNIKPGQVKTLTEHLEECARFHHARLKMLQGITFQKLGLFKHFLVKQPASKETYISHYSVEFLTRFSKVGRREKNPQRVSYVDKCFDEILKNPPEVVQSSNCLNQSRDKTSVYGQQCIASCKQKITLSDDHNRLKGLWRRTSGTALPIDPVTLETILKYARLMHTVTSPIVLDKTNRQNYVALYGTSSLSKNNRSESKQSGMLRSSSFLGSYRRRSGDSLSKLSEKDLQNSALQDDVMDFYQKSFDFISKKFVEFYSDHWKTLLELQISDEIKKSEKVSKNPKVHYRYRSCRGGIILIAFSVHQSYFQVELYSVSASLIDQTNRSNIKNYSNFTSECEKIQGNLNIHQVALDVHIQYLHWYLKNDFSTTTFKFNLYDLLQSVITCYGALLDNVQSKIYQDSLPVACSQVNCQDLYTFLVENAAAFNLQACSVLKDSSEMNESILFSDLQTTEHSSECSQISHQNWNAFNIIFKVDDAETNKLKYHYYLLFYINRARNDLSLTMNKRSSDESLSEQLDKRRLSEAASMIVAGRQEANQTSMQSSSTKTSDFSYVACEKFNVEKRLREYSLTATTECYRSCYLWKKLLCLCQDKNSGKSLTYSEFCTLRSMMQEVAAADYDERISKLFRKRNTVKQIQLIQKRLLKKFSKLSAHVVSPDNSVQHICVLSSKDVHVMIMVTSKSNSSELDITVVKPLPEHIVFHKDCSEQAWKDLLSKVCAALCTSIWMSWF